MINKTNNLNVKLMYGLVTIKSLGKMDRTNPLYTYNPKVYLPNFSVNLNRSKLLNDSAYRMTMKIRLKNNRALFTCNKVSFFREKFPIKENINNKKVIF